jgi:hypothetical protein
MPHLFSSTAFWVAMVVGFVVLELIVTVVIVYLTSARRGN